MYSTWKDNVFRYSKVVFYYHLCTVEVGIIKVLYNKRKLKMKIENWKIDELTN